jgi:H+/Cl- antiporter ClcA
MGKCEEVLKNEETVPIYTSFAIAAGNWICLLSGIPGGLFDPALSTGASLGQMLANSSLNWTTFGDYEAVVLLSMGERKAVG